MGMYNTATRLQVVYPAFKGASFLLKHASNQIGESGLHQDALHWNSSKLGTFACAKRTTIAEELQKQAVARGGCGSRHSWSTGTIRFVHKSTRNALLPAERHR